MQAIEQGAVSDPDVEEFTMFKVGGKPHEPIVVTLGVNGQQLPMEVDTGAAVFIISSTTRANLFHSCLLNSTSTVLTTYTGDRMIVVGEMKVEVSYREPGGQDKLYDAHEIIPFLGMRKVHGNLQRLNK